MRKIFKNKIIIAIAVIVAILSLYLKLKPSTKIPQYQTAQAEKGNLVAFLSLSGQVSGSNSATVTTSATGIIKKVFVKDGDQVKIGQKIAEIELDLLGRQNAQTAYATYQNTKNSLASAQNSLRSAEASLAVIYDQVKGHDTDETLVQKETRTKAEVAKDNAYLGVVNAQAAISSAWLKYHQASLIVSAPISGTITGFSFQPGSVISSSATKIANIYTQAMPSIIINLTEIDVGKVRVGQKATLTFDSQPDKTFTGKIISVDTVGAVSSGVVSYPALIVLDTSVSGLLPNMAATAKIITDTRENVLLIPSSAIKMANGQSVIGVLKNNLVTSVIVETGLTDGSSTEIVSGLGEGDTVVITTTAATTNRSRSGSSPSIFGGGNFMRMGR